MTDKDKDEIRELIEKIRPADAEVDEDRDGDEAMADFARRFRGANRSLFSAFANLVKPGIPPGDLLPEGPPPLDEGRRRELDARAIRDIEQMTQRIDTLINDLRAFRDTIEYEAERRRWEDYR